MHELSASSSRDRHLFGPGPKRLLALDGGGVRGAITVAFLERIEMLLSRQEGKDARLGQHFDLVGGTSTGAIIAGALALGYHTEQVKDFYLRLAPHVFKRQFWHVPILQAKFDARGLRREIDAVVGDRELASDDLITGLSIVTKRMDTGSQWILTNNPRAPYWDDGPDYIGNKHYKLATLVRASTAAPHFFDPEILAISKSESPLPDAVAKPFDQPFLHRIVAALIEHLRLRRGAPIDPRTHGLFVDGGASPHANPALALFLMTQFKSFGLSWPASPEKLTIVSVGTGSHRPRLSFEHLGFARFPKLAYHALLSLVNDAKMQVLAEMQWMGECRSPWVINSEIGTLGNDAPPGGKLFRFLRYDVRLETDWLAQELDIKVSERDVFRFRCMDDPGIVHEIYEIACIAAERQVRAEDWMAPGVA